MEKAIVTACSANYVFAFASLLISLKKNSYNAIKNVDFLCYTENVTEEQKQIILSIHGNVKFRDVDEVNKLPVEILSDNLINNTRWGRYVLVKLLCFDLIKFYDKVLFLDTDMIVRKDISPIFNYTNIAWRKIKEWSGQNNFQLLFPEEKNIIACSGGCILFSRELRDFSISYETLLKAYRETANLKRGGIEEKILTYIAYRYGIHVSELPIEYNCPMMEKEIENASIVHFLDNTENHKPWQNYLIASLFPDLMNNIEIWRNLGGENPMNDASFSNFHDRYTYIRNMKRMFDVLSTVTTSCYKISNIKYNIDPCNIAFEIDDKVFSILIRISIRGNFKDEIRFSVNKNGIQKCFFQKNISRFIKRSLEKEGFVVFFTYNESSIVFSCYLSKKDYFLKLRKFVNVCSATVHSLRFRIFQILTERKAFNFLSRR